MNLWDYVVRYLVAAGATRSSDFTVRFCCIFRCRCIICNICNMNVICIIRFVGSNGRQITHDNFGSLRLARTAFPADQDTLVFPNRGTPLTRVAKHTATHVAKGPVCRHKRMGWQMFYFVSANVRSGQKASSGISLAICGAVEGRKGSERVQSKENRTSRGVDFVQGKARSQSRDYRSGVQMG